MYKCQLMPKRDQSCIIHGTKNRYFCRPCCNEALAEGRPVPCGFCGKHNGQNKSICTGCKDEAMAAKTKLPSTFCEHYHAFSTCYKCAKHCKATGKGRFPSGICKVHMAYKGKCKCKYNQSKPSGPSSVAQALAGDGGGGASDQESSDADQAVDDMSSSDQDDGMPSGQAPSSAAQANSGDGGVQAQVPSSSQDSGGASVLTLPPTHRLYYQALQYNSMEQMQPPASASRPTVRHAQAASGSTSNAPNPPNTPPLFQATEGFRPFKRKTPPS